MILLFSRFTNILPYDHTLLKLNEPIEECSYINATWITTATQQSFDGKENIPLHSVSKISFFSSQGPLPRTVPHHLQMIHEQRPTAVIMLTKLEEGPKDGKERILPFSSCYEAKPLIDFEIIYH